MLRKAYPVMKQSAALLSFLFATSGAFAQAQSPAPAATPVTAPAASAAPAEEEEQVQGYIPYGNLEKASKEDIAKAQQLGVSVAKELLDVYKSRATPEMFEEGLQQKRRADDIGNAAMAAEREKIMDFLGIDPEADTALYYFVSWSMPIEMLRSYAVEAMWSGGTLIFKGIPPGKDLATFLTKDLKDLVYGKGASASISIDPRMFDAYDIKTVPTIVFSTVRDNMACQGVNPVSFKSGDKDLSYDTCPSLDPSTYYKMSGAVTSNYALQTFIDDGAHGAKPYMAALAKGWVGGNVPDKSQKPFTGKWEDVLSPDEKAAASSMADTIQSLPSSLAK